MKFIIKETNEAKNVTLRAWGEDRWGADCFHDLEDNVASVAEWDDPNAAWVISAEKFQEMVDYWQDEVDTYNNDGWSEQFGDKDACNVDEYSLDVE